MAKTRKIREKGKLQLSRYFQKMNPKEIVAIVKNSSIPSNFPDRIQGKTGVVESKRGKAYVIRVKDIDKEKKFLIEPIHLKKIQNKK